jgi:zona occludens toxin (predicted ATPase)
LRLPPLPEQQQGVHGSYATQSMVARAVEQGASPTTSSAVAEPAAAPSPAPMDAAVAMLAEMFGVQADTAQVALHYCDSDVAAAGRLSHARSEDEAWGVLELLWRATNSGRLSVDLLRASNVGRGLAEQRQPH